jgi:hypothetical protein
LAAESKRLIYPIRAIPIAGYPGLLSLQSLIESMNFERPFAEIWEFTPFCLSHGVNEFLSRFTVDGAFEAERFWEYVAISLGKKRPSRKATSRPRKPKLKVV